MIRSASDKSFMARKLLIALLIISLLIELAIAFGAIITPRFALQQFKIGETPDTAFLAYTVGWLCLFVSLICALVLYRVWYGKGDYATLGYLLGFWWIALGIGIYIAFGKADNLLLNSLKGLLLTVLINKAMAGEPTGYHRRNR